MPDDISEDDMKGCSIDVKLLNPERILVLLATFLY